MRDYDIIVVGAGPAGAVCAALFASHGQRTLLLDKERYPRDKVCGDCINPAAWPILDRLELRSRLLRLDHGTARTVEYWGAFGERLSFPQPESRNPEIIVKRRDLDALLVERAIELGAEFRSAETVCEIRPRWTVTTGRGEYRARILIAADGRNSFVARAAGLLEASRRERIAIQQHVPVPWEFEDRVALWFHQRGYGGLASAGGGLVNVCVVAPPAHIAAVREAAIARFQLPSGAQWRAIAPLSRCDAKSVSAGGLFLIGDAARVVEPFTGEGIFYAMRSAELAHEAIVAPGLGNREQTYRRAHRSMYCGRLWINRLAKIAALSPILTSHAIQLFRFAPEPIAFLTAQVVRDRGA